MFRRRITGKRPQIWRGGRGRSEVGQPPAAGLEVGSFKLPLRWTCCFQRREAGTDRSVVASGLWPDL